MQSFSCKDVIFQWLALVLLIPTGRHRQIMCLLIDGMLDAMRAKTRRNRCQQTEKGERLLVVLVSQNDAGKATQPTDLISDPDSCVLCSALRFARTPVGQVNTVWSLQALQGQRAEPSSSGSFKIAVPSSQSIKVTEQTFDPNVFSEACKPPVCSGTKIEETGFSTCNLS